MTTNTTRNTSSSSRSNVEAGSKKWEAAPSTRQTPAQKQSPQQNPSRSGSINTPGQKTGTTINPNTNKPQGGFGGGSTGTTGGRR